MDADRLSAVCVLVDGMFPGRLGFRFVVGTIGSSQQDVS